MLLLNGTIPYDRAKNRPEEGSGREYAESYPAVNGGPDIRKDASCDGRWSGTKDTAKESTEHDGFNVLCHGDGNLHYRKYPESNIEWTLPAKSL